MAILVNRNSRVIIQGATGKQGQYHTAKMLEYHVQVIGGVTPGKGGTEVQGVPVFDTVSQAKKAWYHRCFDDCGATRRGSGSSL